MTTIRRLAVWLLVIVGFGASLVVCGRVAERGRYAVAYSTHGAGPEGTKGLFELSRALGERPVRWSQDFARLPPGAMVVALGGCEVLLNREVSRYEREALERFVEAGGTLVVAGANDYLWDGLGVDLERPRGCSPADSFVRELARAERGEEVGEGPSGEDAPRDDGHDEPSPTEPPPDLDELERALSEDPAGTLEALSRDPEDGALVFAVPEKGGMFAGLGAVPLSRPSRLVVDDDVEATSLLFHDGRPVAVQIARGRGAIVVLASASPFQNANLDSADGAVVFHRILGAMRPQGPLLFDEYHLGVGSRRSLAGYLRSVGAAPFVVQLLVIVALFALRRGRRFGAIRAEPEEPPRGTASYVGAVGSLYEKSGDARSALGRVVKDALCRVASHHHVDAGPPEQVARALEERARDDEARAVRALQAIAATPKVTSHELVDRIRDVDALVARATRAAHDVAPERSA